MKPAALRKNIAQQLVLADILDAISEDTPHTRARFALARKEMLHLCEDNARQMLHGH